MKFFRNVRLATVLAAAALAAAAASAQQAGPSYGLGTAAWRPAPYVGLNLGSARYRLDCGPLGCEQPRLAGQAYAGAMFNPYIGAEVAYLNRGDADRGGGTTRAEGINLGLVGRAPLGAGVGLVGRIGTVWGRTRVDGAPGAGIATGRASGWGPSYGLGVDWAFATQWSAVLDWQRHRFDFAGDDNAWVGSTSVGLKYRF